MQCGGPLSLEGVEQAEGERAELGQLADLLEDPKVRAFLARKLAAQRHPQAAPRVRPGERTGVPGHPPMA